MTPGELITTDGQLEWRGVLLGTASPYRMTKLEGWLDLAEVRGQDTPRPTHGLLQGSQLMGKRVVTLTYLIKGVPVESFGAAVATLRAITAPAERPLEEPLVIRLDGQSWQVNARCVRRSINVAKYYSLGYTTGSIQWQATDPRLYSTVESTSATGLAAPQTDGLPFPLVFPLVMGTGRQGGVLLARNAGDVATWPVLVVTGPVLGPVVTNRDTGQRLVFDPAFPVAAGQRLVLDTDTRTVLLNGANRNDRLLTRQWFPIPAHGSVHIGFEAGGFDPAARLTARWRHATI
ncbi:hypothetical protein GCM10010174_22930 [Kutzneria viridogrisea]|uniref:Siphovirus-type tail component C-terminal domain-containing protein n=1 Tax=Kutzneria viridogrisea TaxID=47990 RepID=A0ABR6BSL0_9PSEU|nr:hypothetical protein [Kutzneria viridogrisea]